MARVLGTITCATDTLKTRAQLKLYPGYQSTTHKIKAKDEAVWPNRTVWELIWAAQPALSLYSHGKARFGTNGWKIRSIVDPAKGDMTPEGLTFLKKENFHVIVGGAMKNHPHKRDLEKPWCIQNTKHSGSFALMEKNPNTKNRGLKKVFPHCMDEDLIQIFIKTIGGRNNCM